MHLERFYSSVFDQCSSPCGKYLACCNTFGRISIFNLQEATTSINEIKKPHFTFKVGTTAYCLATCGDLLVCGMEDGEIRMYSWESLINKTSRMIHHLTSPSAEQGVVSICLDGQTLFSSHGAVVHQWDVNQAFKHLGCLKGVHSDYIHSVKVCRQQVHTASEDGSIVTWDSRSQQKSHVLVPTSDKNCLQHGVEAGTTLGKWVKSIAVSEDKDYLVCGGGFKMSLWYPGYDTATTVFNLNDKNHDKYHNMDDGSDNKDSDKMEVDGDNAGKTYKAAQGVTNHIIINNGTIMSCGDSDHVTTWATNGDVLSSLPCSSFNLYNIHVNQQAPQLLTVAGSSNSIDACINFNYKSFSLHMT